MKTRIQIALMGALISVAIHIYLTMHFYPLKFGFSSGQSVCNLSAKFDCDAVAASSFSSLFGMPIALFGAATNTVLFVLLLLSWLAWTEHPERLKRWTLLLAGTSVGASVIMGAISLTQMQAYCLFCIAVYALSLIIYFSFRGLVQEPVAAGLTADLKQPGELKGILLAFAAIPVLAFAGHRSFMQNMGDAQIDTMVREALQDWQASPKKEFVAKPSLVMGPAADQAAMTLVEFADFRCSHCRHASYTLDAFVKSHPDVRFEFYTFPLDGACNEKIEHSSGISCRLATAVICAEKEGKGWDMHGKLFDIQDEVNRLQTAPELEPVVAQAITALGLNPQTMLACMNDPASMDAIKAQAKQGALVNVQGTPTMFVNGKQLNAGQILPVLQAVRLSAIENKGK